MAIDEVFVDPSLNSDTGNGVSLGTAYGDLQYAINNTTLGTEGTRFNVVGGTAEVLTAALSFVAGFTGTPSSTAPIIIQGCTSTPGDGGRGSIQGTTNSVQILADATADGPIVFIDMDLSPGAANGLQGNETLVFIDCDISGVERLTQCNSVFMVGCYATHTDSTNSTMIGSDTDNYGYIFGCHLVAAPTTDEWMAVRRTLTIFSVLDARAVTNGGFNGVNGRDFLSFINNTFLGNSAPTGSGAGVIKHNAYNTHSAISNAFEGFTNTNPANFTGAEGSSSVIGNAEYGSTAGFSIVTNDADEYAVVEGNIEAIASVFEDFAGGDFTAAGEALEAGWPSSYLGLPGLTSNIDAGAIQYEPPAPPVPTGTIRMGMQLLIPVTQ